MPNESGLEIVSSPETTPKAQDLSLEEGQDDSPTHLGNQEGGTEIEEEEVHKDSVVVVGIPVAAHNYTAQPARIKAKHVLQRESCFHIFLNQHLYMCYSSLLLVSVVLELLHLTLF